VHCMPPAGLFGFRIKASPYLEEHEDHTVVSHESKLFLVNLCIM